MKICVYAIAKDEEKFAERWALSTAAADGRYVLDTGSFDRTVEILRKNGVHVDEALITPWRFDTARNLSLAMVPKDADICVCVDMDEVLSDGWRQELEQAWTGDVQQVRFTCLRSRKADGSFGTHFLIGRAHSRQGFVWRYPVHEVLVREDDSFYTVADAPKMVAEHLPDFHKSRGQYLPLLEMGVREYPDDSRCWYYLGREYYYYQRWQQAIETLERYLDLHSAYLEERSAAMRMISECFLWLGNHRQAMVWAYRAEGELSYELRENWYHLQKMCYYTGDWQGVLYYGRRCVSIVESSRNTINEQEAWGAAPHDLMSIAYWKLSEGRQGWYLDGSLREARLAARIDPENERIRKNVDWLEQYSRPPGGGSAEGGSAI